jgi:hypothetical protein
MTGPDRYAEAEAHHRQAEISMLRTDLEPEERARLADYALWSATVHALLAAAAADLGSYVNVGRMDRLTAHCDHDSKPPAGLAC